MTRYMKFEDVLEALNEIRCSDCSCEKPLDCSLCQIGSVHKQILTKPVYLDVVPKSEIAKEIIYNLAEKLHSMLPYKIYPIPINGMCEGNSFDLGKEEIIYDILAYLNELEKKYK